MEKADDDQVKAVLRSDAPIPFLHLWDPTIDWDIVPEWVEYTEETSLYVHLQGEIGSSSRSVDLYVEDMVELIESLRKLIDLRILQWHGAHMAVWKSV